MNKVNGLSRQRKHASARSPQAAHSELDISIEHGAQQATTTKHDRQTVTTAMSICITPP